MLEHLTLAERIAGSITAILILLGMVAGWITVVRPRIRKGIARVTAALDTIAGRPPVTDSITGRELSPELPSIGKRMDTIEGSVSRLVGVIESQHTQDERLDAHEERLEKHAEQIKQLQDAVIERVATKAESVAAFRAIEAIAKQGDLGAPEIEDPQT